MEVEGWERKEVSWKVLEGTIVVLTEVSGGTSSGDCKGQVS